MTESNDFQKWCAMMGFNGKQVGEAGKSIGISQQSAVRTNTGRRELTETDRLAMAAVRAGLKPWTPETDKESAAMGAVFDLIRSENGKEI